MSYDMPKRIGQGIDLLSDPIRRRLVVLIALGQGQPSRLASRIGLSRPATARQLRLLREAGLITCRRHPADRRRRLYSVEPRRLAQIAAWLAGTEIGRPMTVGDLPLTTAAQPIVEPDKLYAERVGKVSLLRVTVPLERNQIGTGPSRARADDEPR